MKKKPSIMGRAVPTAKSRRKDDVFPAKKEREIDEKRNAERPKPEMTSPVVIPLLKVHQYLTSRKCDFTTYHMIRKRLGGRVH